MSRVTPTDTSGNGLEALITYSLRNEADINHFANQWILPKGKNINKSNRHPKKYFSAVSDSELARAHIDRKLLDYRRYRTFLRDRSARVLGALEKKTGLSQDDFENGG